MRPHVITRGRMFYRKQFFTKHAAAYFKRAAACFLTNMRPAHFVKHAAAPFKRCGHMFCFRSSSVFIYLHLQNSGLCFTNLKHAAASFKCAAAPFKHAAACFISIKTRGRMFDAQLFCKIPIEIAPATLFPVR